MLTTLDSSISVFKLIILGKMFVFYNVVVLLVINGKKFWVYIIITVD